MPITPAVIPEVLAKLEGLARNDVPLLHVCGSIDPILGKYSTTIENIYQQFGGRISVMIKEGVGHHPHSLRDPKPIADFIEQSVAEAAAPVAPPALLGTNSAKATTTAPTVRTATSLRRAIILPAAGRFSRTVMTASTSCLDSPASITIIAPIKEAPGRPWVYRAGLVGGMPWSIRPCWQKDFISSSARWATTMARMRPTGIGFTTI